MLRTMEKEILKAIGLEAVYYSEILEQLSGGGAISDDQTQDFQDSLQSLKDKGHISNQDYTTGEETSLFQLTKVGRKRWARIMKREGLM